MVAKSTLLGDVFPGNVEMRQKQEILQIDFYSPSPGHFPISTMKKVAFKTIWTSTQIRLFTSIVKYMKNSTPLKQAGVGLD